MLIHVFFTCQTRAPATADETRESLIRPDVDPCSVFSSSNQLLDQRNPSSSSSSYSQYTTLRSTLYIGHLSHSPQIYTSVGKQRDRQSSTMVRRRMRYPATSTLFWPDMLCAYFWRMDMFNPALTRPTGGFIDRGASVRVQGGFLPLRKYTSHSHHLLTSRLPPHHPLTTRLTFHRTRTAMVCTSSYPSFLSL